MGALVLGVEQTRSQGTLGASEAPAALGLDKYTAPLTVWKRLRGEHVDEDRSPALQEAADFGNLFEPILRGRYALQRGCAVVVPVTSRVLGGWLHATSDGYVLKPGKHDVGTYEEQPDNMTDDDEIDGLIQVKTRSAFLRDEWERGVPAKEEVQIRVELAVLGQQWSDCIVLLGGNRMLVHRIERDEKLEANILEGLAAFWRCVQEGKEPAVDGSDAWRAEVSARMSRLRGKVVIAADDELRELAAYWMAQRRLRKKHQEEEDAAKNDLLLRMSAAGATGIQLDKDSRITAYPAGARTDWKSYCLSIGGKATPPEQFKTAASSWALRAPKDDEE